MSVIRCLFSHLVARCKERGYDIHNVMPCITKIEGDYILVDTEHIAYPQPRKTPAEIEAQAQAVKAQYAAPKRLPYFAPPSAALTNFGPGTELKKMLSKIGIKASPTCSCNARAQAMDTNGIEWCKANTDTIVGWLREEATKRGLPFIDLAGKIIVKRAISLAEKAEKQLKQAENANPAPNG